MRWWHCIPFMFGLLSVGWAQEEVRVGGFFQDDSVLLGVPTPFILTCSYPLAKEVFFPDSSANFAPFEWVRKAYFPSREDSGYLYDSAVYYLSTFELEPVQALRVAVVVQAGTDTLSRYSSLDSIYIAGLVHTFPADATAQQQLDYQLLHLAFNYPYVVALGAIGLVVLIVLFFIFKRPVQRRIRLYLLRKRYEAFERTFYVQYHTLQDRIDIRIVEKTLLLWKRYLETLERQHYAKLTTQEIHAREQNPGLKKTLEHIDRMIYAGQTPEDAQELRTLLTLKDVAHAKYRYKTTTIRHA